MNVNNHFPAAWRLFYLCYFHYIQVIELTWCGIKSYNKDRYLDVEVTVLHCKASNELI